MVPKQTILLLTNFHRTASVLRNQNPIPNPNTTPHPLPLLIQPPRSHSQDARLVQLLDAALGEVDAGGGLGGGFDALDEDAVEEGSEGFDGFEGG